MQMNVAAADTIPTWPIWSAKIVNFCCNGVSYSYFCNTTLSFPYWECVPTANTSIAPVPSLTLEPEIRKLFPFLSYYLFEVGGNFLIPSGSPVIADSSATILWL